MKSNQWIWLIGALFLLDAPCCPVHADLDWGGGTRRFVTAGEEPLTVQNGLAVIISVNQGGLIDITASDWRMAPNLIEPGAVLTRGESINRVLGSSQAFLDGYLLLTAVADMTTEKQVSYGADAGEPLYLVVWDRNTFIGEKPGLGSRFVDLQLFRNGNKSEPATTYGPDLPSFADTIYPDKDVDIAICNKKIDRAMPGDVDGSGTIDLRDVIVTLQIMGRTIPPSTIRADSDVNGDGQLGLAEAIYILWFLADTSSETT